MKKYEEILKTMRKEKLDTTKLYILSCITYDKQDKLLTSKVLKMLDYIYDTWLEIDGNVCLEKLCDLVCENWEEIKKDEYTFDDICIDLFD